MVYPGFDYDHQRKLNPYPIQKNWSPPKDQSFSVPSGEWVAQKIHTTIEYASKRDLIIAVNHDILDPRIEALCAEVPDEFFDRYELWGILHGFVNALIELEAIVLTKSKRMRFSHNLASPFLRRLELSLLLAREIAAEAEQIERCESYMKGRRNGQA